MEKWYSRVQKLYKYLSVLVDKDLTWKYHIDAITAKISKTIGLISKLWHSIPHHILLYIYQTLIHPHLNYGLAVWGQASKTSLNKILILQKKVLRMMYFTGIREHAILLFIDADIFNQCHLCIIELWLVLCTISTATNR